MNDWSNHPLQTWCCSMLIVTHCSLLYFYRPNWMKPKKLSRNLFRMQLSRHVRHHFAVDYLFGFCSYFCGVIVKQCNLRCAVW